MLELQVSSDRKPCAVVVGMPDMEQWVIGEIPGTSLEAKIEYMANVLGIAGFAMSLGMIAFGLIYRRGRRRAATLGDFEAFGAMVASTISQDLVDRLTKPEIARMRTMHGYTPALAQESTERLRTKLSRILAILSHARTDDANAAAAAMLCGNTGPAENFFDALAEQALAEPVQLAKAAEALHLKATLEVLRDPASALKSCSRAVQLDTSDAEGWRQLGHVHLRLGQIEEAQRAFAQSNKDVELH